MVAGKTSRSKKTGEIPVVGAPLSITARVDETVPVPEVGNGAGVAGVPLEFFKLLSESASDDESCCPIAITFRSKVNEQRLVEIRRDFGIPACYSLYVHKDLRACLVPKDDKSLVLFEKSFVHGLRLPFCRFVEEVLNYYQVSPGQLTPNSWGIMTLFMIAFDKAKNRCEGGDKASLSVDCFKMCCEMRKVPTTDMGDHRAENLQYYFMKRPGFSFSPKQKRQESNWLKRFFGVRSDVPWQVPTKWVLHSSDYLKEKNVPPSFESSSPEYVVCKYLEKNEIVKLADCADNALLKRLGIMPEYDAPVAAIESKKKKDKKKKSLKRKAAEGAPESGKSKLRRASSTEAAEEVIIGDRAPEAPPSEVEASMIGDDKVPEEYGEGAVVPLISEGGYLHSVTEPGSSSVGVPVTVDGEIFRPDWNISKEGPFASDSTAAREAIASLSLLDQVSFSGRTSEELAAENYTAHATAWERSHSFICMARKATDDISKSQSYLRELSKLAEERRVGIESLESENAKLLAELEASQKSIEDSQTATTAAQLEVEAWRKQLESGVASWKKRYLGSELFYEEAGPWLLSYAERSFKDFIRLGEARVPGLGEKLKGLHLSCTHPGEKRLKDDETCVSYVPWESFLDEEEVYSGRLGAEQSSTSREGGADAASVPGFQEISADWELAKRMQDETDKEVLAEKEERLQADEECARKLFEDLNKPSSEGGAFTKKTSKAGSKKSPASSGVRRPRTRTEIKAASLGAGGEDATVIVPRRSRRYRPL